MSRWVWVAPRMRQSGPERRQSTVPSHCSSRCKTRHVEWGTEVEIRPAKCLAQRGWWCWLRQPATESCPTFPDSTLQPEGRRQLLERAVAQLEAAPAAAPAEGSAARAEVRRAEARAGRRPQVAVPPRARAEEE